MNSFYTMAMTDIHTASVKKELKGYYDLESAVREAKAQIWTGYTSVCVLSETQPGVGEAFIVNADGSLR